MVGFISLDRKIVNWEWYQNPDVFRVFLHLLLCANHKDGKWQGIPVKRGQTITGADKLSKTLRLTRQTIRTSLTKLKSTGEITIKSTNKYSVITICKYDTYQKNNTSSNQQTNPSFNQQLTNQQPTTNQQLTTNNNDNNEDNAISDSLVKPNSTNFSKKINQKNENNINSQTQTDDFLTRRLLALNQTK